MAAAAPHHDDTSTLERARSHARAQAGRRAETGPTVPSRAAEGLPDGVLPEDVVWDELVGPGGYAHRRLPRGSTLRLVDLEGDACASLVVHVADRTAERLNVADTVKVQWQAHLGPGSLLLSDMGRALLTVVSDTSGRHDCLVGCTSRRHNEQRHGAGGAWTATPAARELLVLGAAKHGLERRDVPPSVTLFKGVSVAEDGALTLDGAPRPGAAVELRAEVDVLVTLANAPHPLDDRPTYTATPLRLTAWRGDPTGPDDPLRTSTPERERAFQNLDELLLQVGA